MIAMMKQIAAIDNTGINRSSQRPDGKLQKHPDQNGLGHFQGAREIRETQTRSHAEHDELDQRHVEAGKLEASPTQESRRVE